MPDQQSVFRGAFAGPNEAVLGRGRRPVIFDILTPDETSLLDMVEQDLRLVLHVNPKTMQFSYQKTIDRVQTRGGFVEFHWGDGTETISFEAATGGFMRLYTGLSNITGSGSGSQGRRETLAYSKYIDLLALFHNNGAIYDQHGNIVLHGYIKLTFDEGMYIGWFDNQFTVTEAAEAPYQFNLSANFTINREIMQTRSSSLYVPSGLASAARSVAPEPTSTALLNTLVDPFTVG